MAPTFTSTQQTEANKSNCESLIENFHFEENRIYACASYHAQGAAN